LKIFTARASAELERRNGERAQKEQLHFTQALLDALPNPVFYKDLHGRYLGCNKAFEQLVGLDRNRLIGRTVLETHDQREASQHHREDLALMQEKTARDYTYSLGEADSSIRHFVVRKAPFFSSEGSLGGLIGTVIDITAHKQAEQEIRQLAYFDTLTGLPNRTLLKDRFAQALVFARRDQRPVGVMMIDVDRFKGVNDSHGHAMGDQLLKALADRLRGMVRTSDTVARPGGDEFILLLPAVAHEQDIALVAQKIKETLHPPFNIDGQETFLTVSIGIAVFPLDGQDTDTLLRNADTAMYVAKEQGKNRYQFFSSEMNDKAVARVTLETDLRQGIERGEFSLDYQPQIDLATGVITGVEALLRWHHPQKGIISPVNFIPAAEETGLILPLGEWVLRTACRQARRWHLAGFPLLRMAVNLSALQFTQPDLLEMISGILEETGLPPQSLELEITESMLMENAREARTTLSGLKELGVSLAIDDFGTGYSSLSYLKHFPIDRLKIDQSFVRDIDTHCDDTAIVDSIIALGHSLHLSIIAEGVENEQQLQLLRQGRCHEMQGYFFSRPLSAESCERLLSEGLTAGALRLAPLRGA
ncbi:MAG TPA: EAL domain-containing protein, partial [Desulfuromonadales bacterium]|nr:EAL domain-containing protein [Desulfuromonadales bacterium]